MDSVKTPKDVRTKEVLNFFFAKWITLWPVVVVNLLLTGFMFVVLLLGLTTDPDTHVKKATGVLWILYPIQVILSGFAWALNPAFALAAVDAAQLIPFQKPDHKSVLRRSWPLLQFGLFYTAYVVAIAIIAGFISAVTVVALLAAQGQFASHNNKLSNGQLALDITALVVLAVGSEIVLIKVSLDLGLAPCYIADGHGLKEAISLSRARIKGHKRSLLRLWFLVYLAVVGPMFALGLALHKFGLTMVQCHENSCNLVYNHYVVLCLLGTLLAPAFYLVAPFVYRVLEPKAASASGYELMNGADTGSGDDI